MAQNTERNTDSLSVGSIVHDRNDTNPNPAIVLHRPGVPASDWTIEGTGNTVADYNDDYPADDPTLLVAFESELDDAVPGWDVSTQESLWPYVQDHEVRHYAYPESRLEHVDTSRVRQRARDDGNRFIHRLNITHVGDQLVFGEDYDGVDHQYGTTREVCFHKQNWDVAENNVVHVEYEREKPDIDDLPTMLVGVDDIEIIEQTASPDFLLDL